MSGESSSLIELGVVGAPFGVRGWVKLRSFTDPPDRLLQHRSVQLRVGGSWVAYKIEASGKSGGQLTAKLRGVDDRDRAGELRGAQIGVPRADLPQRDDKDFYRADLIGCEVVNLAGRYLGKVMHFVETPAQVLMVVRGGEAPGEREPRGSAARPGGSESTAAKEYWVPAVPLHLRRVDLAARRVVVDWDDAAE
ncbi:MAG TPA: ribosome maturation factor RimM [Steroidobacteraceae bacterium]|nr:ribosome maturation factor RimM [Steroidobacteraceae bacterium]